MRVLKQRQKDEREGIVSSDSSLDLQSLIETIEKSSTKPRCDEGTFCHLFDDIAHTKSFIHPWSPIEVCSKLDCSNSECERAHICRSGGRCLLSDEYFHRQRWIHPKKTDCNEGTSCSLLNDEDHLNLYSHPGIQDFRPACQKTAAELKGYYPPETRKALFLLQCIHSRAKKSDKTIALYGVFYVKDLVNHILEYFLPDIQRIFQKICPFRFDLDHIKQYNHAIQHNPLDQLDFISTTNPHKAKFLILNLLAKKNGLIVPTEIGAIATRLLPVHQCSNQMLLIYSIHQRVISPSEMQKMVEMKYAVEYIQSRNSLDNYFEENASFKTDPTFTKLVTAIAERFYERKPNKLDEFESCLPLAQTKNCFTDLCSKTEELAKTCFQLGQLSSNYYDYDKIDYPEMVNSFSLFFKKDFVILSSTFISTNIKKTKTGSHSFRTKL